MHSNTPGKWFWLWPMVLLIAVGLGVFTDISDNQMFLIPHIDKVAHCLYMALFATLLARRWSFWPVLAAGFIVSAGIEFGQMLTPPRSPDIDDALWGVVGAFFGWAFYQVSLCKKFLEYKLF